MRIIVTERVFQFSRPEALSATYRNHSDVDTVMDNPALILLNLAKSDKIRSKSANVEPNWDELANNAITKRRTKIRSIESANGSDVISAGMN